MQIGGSRDAHAGAGNTGDAWNDARTGDPDCQPVDRGVAAPLRGLVAGEAVSETAVDTAGIERCSYGKRTGRPTDARVGDLSDALSEWGGYGCRAVRDPYTRGCFEGVYKTDGQYLAAGRDAGLGRLGCCGGGSLSADELRHLLGRIRMNLIAASVHVVEKHGNWFPSSDGEH